MKEFSKEEVWNNRQSGKQEIIPLMGVRQLVFKVRIIQSKIDNHKSQIDKLTKVRRIILNTIVEKGKVATDPNQFEKEVVFLNANHDNNEKKPILVSPDTLRANNISIKESIDKCLIILVPDTQRNENL